MPSGHRRGLLWSDPRVKPPFGSVEIDGGHPLAPTVAILGNEGAGPLHDIGLGLVLPLSTGTDWAPAPFGIGVRCNANDEGAFVTIPATLKPATTTTIFWRGIFVAAPGAQANMAVVSYSNDPNESPYIAYGLFAQVDGRAAYNNGSISVIQDGTTVSVGVVVDYALTLDGVTARLYRDGIERANSTVGVGTISYSATARLTVGEHNATGRNPNHITEVVYVWPGVALPPSAIQAVHAEPYADLRPIIRRRYFVPTAVTRYPQRQILIGVGA